MPSRIGTLRNLVVEFISTTSEEMRSAAPASPVHPLNKPFKLRKKLYQKAVEKKEHSNRSKLGPGSQETSDLYFIVVVALQLYCSLNL